MYEESGGGPTPDPAPSSSLSPKRRRARNRRNRQRGMGNYSNQVFKGVIPGYEQYVYDVARNKSSDAFKTTTRKLAEHIAHTTPTMTSIALGRKSVFILVCASMGILLSSQRYTGTLSLYFQGDSVKNSTDGGLMTSQEEGEEVDRDTDTDQHFNGSTTMAMWDHTNTPSFDPSISEHAVVTRDKYLLYYSHSGFSNQLVGMQRAAQLALATNRTLVLPPVLPHHTFQEKLLFPEFPYLLAGTKCEPYRRYDEFIERIELDVKKASSSEIPFPSFTELFSFDDIFIKTGLQVIDMKDFAEVDENTNGTSWCSGRGNNIMRNMMVPKCEKSDGLAFTEIIPKFENTCGNGMKIAAIGSGFVMPGPMLNNRHQQAVFSYFNEKLTPSKKFMQLLKEIYSLLPDNYYGVAIRFRDYLQVDDCDLNDVKEPFKRILHYLSTKKKNNYNNSTEPANGTHHILIGDSNEAAIKCLRHHSQGQYTVSTVRDIVNRDIGLRSMIDRIKSEKSTIYLLFDQILIALAKEVAFDKVGTTAASTFHTRIKLWQRQKDRILGKMGKTLI